MKLLAVTSVLVMITAQAQTPATFALPAPTGTLPIGTTRWVVGDPSRPETFAPGRTREVEVIAWYPAATAGPPSRPEAATARSRRSSPEAARAEADPTAPYMRNGIEEALSFARLAKLGDAYNGLASVKTHSVLDAPVAKTPARFPVIVFSHGYTGLPSSHTALFEDLASHGWAVLHVVHPYEAASTLSDGTFVTFTDEKNAMRAGIMEVLNEWGPEGATMDKVVAATDETEKEKLLRGYLDTLKHTDQVVKRWVLDVKLVLDRRPTSGPGSALASRLDLSRLGVAGHSIGGVMAGQFCVEDRRCRAGLNFDGIPQYGTMIDTLMPAPFLMVYSGRPGRAGASDLIYRRSASKYYRVDVADTMHIDFTEMNLWGGPLRQRGAFGKIAPERAVELTRLLAREYFGQEILGRKSLVLSRDAQPIPGVTVAELRKP